MIVDWIIKLAKRTPYFHLHHADGSLYMERHWLPMPDGALDFDAEVFHDGDGKIRFGETYLTMARSYHGWSWRLHHICTPDYDREMHDHPWNFISVVLRGGYTERRPMNQARARWFTNYSGASPVREEDFFDTVRRAGSIAYRAHNDRHKIVEVEPDTWTLVIMSPKRHSWGFYTEEHGKVGWREFESVHNTRPIR